MKKRVFIPIFVIVLGLFVWGMVKFGPDFNTDEVPVQQVVVLEEEAPTPVVRVYTDESDSYSIEAHYPETTQREVIGYIDDSIASFKIESVGGEATASDKSDLTINYSIEESRLATTYIITSYIYTGGAHGYEDTRTFTYYIETGERITLDMLFEKEGYIPALSALVQNKLKARFGSEADMSMIEAGAGQMKENFERFYLTDTSIIFIFPPYSVASYSEGTIKLEVSLSTLGGLVSEEFFTS